MATYTTTRDAIGVTRRWRQLPLGATLSYPESAERATGSGAGGLRSWAVAKKRPTSDDRVEAMQIALSGIAGESDPVDLASNLQPLHPKNNTFPGEVLLGLAADAIELSCSTRSSGGTATTCSSGRCTR